MRNYFKFLFPVLMFFLFSSFVSSLAEGGDFSENSSKYYVMCESNVSNSETVDGGMCETGNVVAEAGNSNNQFQENYMCSDGTESDTNIDFDISTNTSLMVYYNVTDVTTGDMQMYMYTGTGGSGTQRIHMSSTGGGQFQFNGVNAGGLLVSGANYSNLLVFKRPPGGNLIVNYTRYLVTNKSGSLLYTEDASAADSGLWNGDETSIASFQFRLGGDADCIDELVVWNWTDKALALVRPAVEDSADIVLPDSKVSLNISDFKYLHHVNLTSNVSDDIAVDWCIFGENQTGITVYTNVSVSGTDDECSLLIDISQGKGTVINFSVAVNDTSNNFYTNDTIFTLVNRVFAPSIISPILNTLYSLLSLVLEFVGIYDGDVDSITSVKYYINGSLNVTTDGINSTFNASDGVYNINISVFDGTDWSPNATISSFKMDTTFGTISSLDNSTPFSIDTNQTITGTDANLYGFNCTIYNGTSVSDGIVNSSEFINIGTTTQDIILPFQTFFDDGNFLTSCVVTDDHTDPKIPDYAVSKDQGKLELIFDTPDGNQINIKQKYSDIGLLDYYSYKSNDGKKYIVVYNYSNTSVSEFENTYIFKTNSKNDLVYYRQFSQYNSHFVSGKQWIDYNLKTIYPVVYEVKETQAGKFETTIITRETTLIFESVGGVNIFESNATFEIDITNPVLFDLNFTHGNNTFVFGNGSVNVNISEKNNHSVFMYVDGKFNQSLGAYQPNISRSANLDLSYFDDGNYSVIFGANDTAGNFINQSFLTLVVDNLKPNITNEIVNRTDGISGFIDNVDINITFFANDSYMNGINLSYDFGTPTNISFVVSGNTSFKYVILSSVISSGSASIDFYVSDLAGNIQHTTHSITVSAADNGSISFAKTTGSGILLVDDDEDTFGTCEGLCLFRKVNGEFIFWASIFMIIAAGISVLRDIKKSRGRKS